MSKKRAGKKSLNKRFRGHVGPGGTKCPCCWDGRKRGGRKDSRIDRSIKRSNNQKSKEQITLEQIDYYSCEAYPWLVDPNAQLEPLLSLSDLVESELENNCFNCMMGSCNINHEE